MATGIRRRHSVNCPALDGGRCRCKAGFEASVFLAREGRKVRKTFEKEGEAKAWRAEATTAAAAGKLRSAPRLSVNDAAWLWLEGAHKGAVRDRSGSVYKPGTLREYERSLRLRVLPEFGSVRLGELRRADLQGFADRLLASGLSASSVSNTLNPLQAIFRHAVRRELVPVNPAHDLELPAANGRRDRIASAIEATELLDGLPSRDRALWATAFYAGLRRGELQALRWDDVDLGRSEIRVSRSWDQEAGPVAPKSKAGIRTVPILAVLRDYLDALKIATERGGADLVFGRSADVPFAPKSVKERAERAWKAITKREREKAEQENREAALLAPITLHECRHTFASLLIDAQVNAKAIQTFLGHATIQMTFDRYGHLMPGSREQARDLVDAYLEAAERETRAEAAVLPVFNGPAGREGRAATHLR
ncbi:MAG TPA: tyrosine-type recombinase/integrase [Solirubrobacterales bacterium]|nr:tyrosine-type recombinase/integrase [Solirubrobacterales bacterium]